MYVIKNNNTKLYLQTIIDLKHNLCHYTHDKKDALIFQNKRAIPYCYKNHRWELVKVKDYKLFDSQAISTYKLSQETGLSYSALREYCIGKRDKENMTKKTIDKISKCLDIPRGELLDLLEK